MNTIYDLDKLTTSELKKELSALDSRFANESKGFRDSISERLNSLILSKIKERLEDVKSKTTEVLNAELTLVNFVLDGQSSLINEDAALIRKEDISEELAIRSNISIYPSI